MKKTRSYFYAVLTAMILLPQLLAGQYALAQNAEGAGITVRPAIIEEKLEPGETFSSTIYVTNDSQEPQLYYALTKDIISLNADGQPIYAEEGEKTGYELSSWVRITKEPIAAQPGETKSVPFSIVVPAGASPGAHFGSLFMSLTAEKQKKTGMGVGYQVGTIVSLRIAGAVIEEAGLRDFYTNRSIYSKPKVKFAAQVENIGNTVVKPRGPLEIKNWFGKTIEVIKMNDNAAAILPGQKRSFEAEWEGDGLTFGRYDAVLGLVYGDEGKKTISSATSFWVLPLNIILPVAGSIIGIILIVWVAVKLHIRKKFKALERATAEQAAEGGAVAKAVSAPIAASEAPASKLSLIAISIIAAILLFLLMMYLFA